MSEELKQYRIIVKGIVQGVCFRYYTKLKAEELKINGWVRNKKDGSVEIVAQGQKSSLDAFINWCRQGPSNAKVKEIEVKEEDFSERLDGFYIKL